MKTKIPQILQGRIHGAVQGFTQAGKARRAAPSLPASRGTALQQGFIREELPWRTKHADPQE